MRMISKRKKNKEELKITKMNQFSFKKRKHCFKKSYKNIPLII